MSAIFRRKKAEMRGCHREVMIIEATAPGSAEVPGRARD